MALAALGVYLGLLLAGATPGVLAQQAALTKEFSLKDETERKDDVDNKPDRCDDSELRNKITEYEATFLWFSGNSISEYKHLLEIFIDAYPEKVDAIDVSWRSVGEYRPTRQIKTSLAYPHGILDEETSSNLDREVLRVGNGLPGKSFTFTVLRNAFATEFTFESKQIPYGAPLVRTLYSASLKLCECPPNLVIDDLIYRNTQLVVQGDHLVITTRLPRGSLDALFSTNRK